MRVLIAEKDMAFRKNLADMLIQAGYQVVGEASDGITALKMAHSLQPDLVLLDASLPGLSGLELARIIEESRVAALVMLVEYSEKDMVQKNGEGFSFPVMIKPCDRYHLLSMIEYAYSVFNRVCSLEREVNRLKGDLETRKIVEKAKGILMRVHGLSEDEAFKRMQQQSMKKRTSMKNIAKAIITAFEI